MASDIHENIAALKNTHLMSWLEHGYEHCRRGGKDWCQGYLDSARQYIEALEAALAAQDAQAQRTDGWVMVPVEPTYEMARAIGCSWEGNIDGIPPFPQRWKKLITVCHSTPSDPRKEALEEAARIAETIGVYPVNVFAGGPEWYRHAKRIAAAIRALSSEPVEKGERG